MDHQIFHLCSTNATSACRFRCPLKLHAWCFAVTAPTCNHWASSTPLLMPPPLGSSGGVTGDRKESRGLISSNQGASENASFLLLLLDGRKRSCSALYRASNRRAPVVDMTMHQTRSTCHIEGCLTDLLLLLAGLLLAATDLLPFLFGCCSSFVEGAPSFVVRWLDLLDKPALPATNSLVT